MRAGIFVSIVAVAVLMARRYPGGQVPIRCRVLGHDFRFAADGRTMTWTCARGCAGVGGEKVYDSEADARRYARALDSEAARRTDHRPLLSTLPLKLARGLGLGRRR